jgi:hypothetical protein
MIWANNKLKFGLFARMCVIKKLALLLEQLHKTLGVETLV